MMIMTHRRCRILVALKTHPSHPKMTKRKTGINQARIREIILLQDIWFRKENSKDYNGNIYITWSRLVELLKPVGSYFTDEADFETHRSTLQSQKYNDHTSKYEKRMNIQEVSAVLKSLDTIYVLSFLQKFRAACESNEIYKEALSVFSHFKKKADQFRLTIWHERYWEPWCPKKEYLTTYHQVVYYLLKNYATNNVIGEGEADVMRCKQPRNMSVFRFVLLCILACCCNIEIVRSAYMTVMT